MQPSSHAQSEPGEPVSADVLDALEQERREEERHCPGACNFLTRKNGRGVFVLGEPILCERCMTTLRNELLAIDTLAGMLAAQDDGHRTSTGSDAAIRAHRSGTGRRSPSSVVDTISELESVLRGHMRIKRPVAHKLGLLARPVTELADWLASNLPRYRDDREALIPLYEDVRRWHSRLVKMAKAGQALISKPLPCPRCRERGLVQERGSDVVKCTSPTCGKMMSARDYDDLAAEAAEAAAAGAEPTPVRKRGAKAPVAEAS